MVRWLLVGVALFAGSAGVAGALAQHDGSRGAQVASVTEAGSQAAEAAASGAGAPGLEVAAAARERGREDESERPASALQGLGQQDCEEEATTHGCAVRTAVHEAQEATDPGPERGVAVSTAARTADCSMLPEGAQAACAKRAEKAHPNADGVPGNKPSAAAAPSSSPGKGKGPKPK
ncbi:MAG TPA: hypothetical protein VNN10_10560 [Dehalococcoidia bacterium]|nr:hypothetical protein [Dehalococcoidia bacterium]